jgi:hypothetical protein
MIRYLAVCWDDENPDDYRQARERYSLGITSDINKLDPFLESKLSAKRYERRKRSGTQSY